MKPETESLLFDRHPQLLDRENLPYGLQVGEGWCVLIDQLCARMQAEIDAGRAAQVVFVQVKEKHGALRCYIAPRSEPVLNALRDFAQDLSEHICEICGAPSHTFRGDRMVRCAAHRGVRSFEYVSSESGRATAPDALVQYAHSNLTKEQAIAALGLRDYAQLLVRLGDAGLALPTLPDDDLENQATLVEKLLGRDHE